MMMKKDQLLLLLFVVITTMTHLPSSLSFTVNNHHHRHHRHHNYHHGIMTRSSTTTTTTNMSNRLFLDTAVESEWSSLLPLGIFHGITTNPTLLEKAGHECTIPSIQQLALQALSLPNCNEFMCQAWGQTSMDMYKVGLELSQIDRCRIVIKVPVTFQGTKAASLLIESGVRVCLTACYSSDQALIAAGLGAEYIAPYLGRMTDNGKDGMDECRRMQTIVQGMKMNTKVTMNGSSSSNSNSNNHTRVLVASIRDVKSMTDLIASGTNMDTFTFSPDVARMLFDDALTDQAAADFEAAAQRCGAGGDDDDDSN
jgi:transaldolase